MSRAIKTMGRTLAGSLEWCLANGERHHDLVAAGALIASVVLVIAAIAQ